MSEAISDHLVSIFIHLPIRDIGRTARVCTAWKRAAARDEIWRAAAFRLNPHAPTTFREGPKAYVLNLLKNHELQEREKVQPKRPSACVLFERGKRLWIAYAMNTVKLALRPINGQELTLTHSPGAVTAITPLGSEQIAFGYDCGQVSLWDGREIPLYSNFKQPVSELFNLSGFLVARYDTATLLLNTADWSGRLEGELNRCNSELAVVDGHLYAAYIPGGQDTPQVMDLGVATGPDTLKPMTQSRVAWIQQEGQTLVAVARTQNVALFSFADGKLDGKVEVTFKPQASLCQGLEFLPSLDSLAWIGANGILQIIDLKTSESRDTQWPGVIKQLEVVSRPHPILILKPDGQPTCFWDPSDKEKTREVAPEGARVVQHHDSALGPVFAVINGVISIRA